MWFVASVPSQILASRETRPRHGWPPYPCSVAVERPILKSAGSTKRCLTSGEIP
jgi:hypothetical protein